MNFFTSSANVKLFYQNHFDELGEYEKFHYLTRMWLWKNDNFSRIKLKKIKDKFQIDKVDSIKNIEYNLDFFINKVTPNYSGKRKYYLKNYPKIRLFGAYFFRRIFYSSLFNTELSKLIYLPDKTEVQYIFDKINEDRDLLFTLSTFSLNFLFLSAYIFSFDLSSVKKFVLEQIHHKYNLNDNSELQNYIYFFTHMVIGESLFYTKKISDEEKSFYKNSFNIVENVIEKNMKRIHLDNKLEFVVTSKLLGYETKLNKLILNEAENSKSSEGDFIIDRHNTFLQSHRTSFVSSEHRNVLYIMSDSDYNFSSLEQIIS